MTRAFVTWVGAVLLLGGAACSESSPAPTSASADAGARGVDPFCETRPRLSFCEDFDVAALPGAFDAVEGDADLLTLEPRADAPSAPRVVALVPKGARTDARLVTFAKEGIKYNLFFLAQLQRGHGRVDLAGLEDGEYKLVIGLDAADTWYVEETRIDPDGGTSPSTRTLTTKVAVDPNDLTAVRLDVYVDGAGRGHMRFRSGDDLVFEAEPLTFPRGRAALAPKVFVGGKLRDGVMTKLEVDSVTLGED